MARQSSRAQPNRNQRPQTPVPSTSGYPYEEDSFEPTTRSRQQLSGHIQAPKLQTAPDPSSEREGAAADLMPSIHGVDGQQIMLQSLVSAQRDQSQSESREDSTGPGSAGTQLGTGGSPEASSTTTATQFKRAFRMVIHLGRDDTAQRLTTLDTGADVNLISLDVVKELGLHRDPYKGEPLKAFGTNFTPQWQVKFDWHVAKFSKTYRTTFAVCDVERSKEFDILLGEGCIKDVGFYTVNSSVWYMRTKDDYCVSKAVDVPDDSFPSIEEMGNGELQVGK
ncbi:MAG: hypothetical protein Q9166_001964 [cf. Caloplaca sp. 2 TL-2023]